MKKVALVLFIVFISLINANGQSKIISNDTITIDDKPYSTYTIKKGDGWYSIARKFKITYPELRLANKKNDKLIAGNKIFIPLDRIKIDDPYFDKKYINKSGIADSSFHTVKKGETLFGICRKYHVTVSRLKQWNNLSSGKIFPGQKLFILKKESGETNRKKNIRERAETPVNTQENKNSASFPSENISDEQVIFAKNRVEVKESGIASVLTQESNDTNKYYAWHRSAPVGTIIRVINITNAKKVYVRITGELKDSSEEKKVIIKISKASAELIDADYKNVEVSLLYGVNK